jgi:outer membrane protein OmpA-like peptidoglycan-associated protein
MAEKAKAAACKCKKGECEECPEWIFTFADLVMLMMGFFVILWVLKPNPTPPSTVGPNASGAASAAAADQHWIDTVAAVRQAFGATGDPHSDDPVSVQLARRQLLTPAGEKDQGKSAIKAEGATGIDQTVQSIRRAKMSVTGGVVKFARGSATLSTDLVQQLDQVAVEVKGRLNLILIQGHTSLDDFGESGTAQQKLDLSIRRAQAVADRLTADGVSPDVLRVVGCSTFEPVVTGEYTPNVQADNRRVEVQVSTMTTTEVQAARPTTTDNVGK